MRPRVLSLVNTALFFVTLSAIDRLRFSIVVVAISDRFGDAIFHSSGLLD